MNEKVFKNERCEHSKQKNKEKRRNQPAIAKFLNVSDTQHILSIPRTLDQSDINLDRPEHSNKTHTSNCSTICLVMQPPDRYRTKLRVAMQRKNHQSRPRTPNDVATSKEAESYVSPLCRKHISYGIYSAWGVYVTKATHNKARQKKAKERAKR